MITYQDSSDAVRQIRAALQQPARLQQLARHGHSLMSSVYSKAEQWRAFVSLVETT